MAETTETIIFRGVLVKDVAVRGGDKSGSQVFTEFDVTAEFSTIVREAMDWDEPGDCLKPGATVPLKGNILAAQTLVLTPGDKKLQKAALKLGIKEATNFKLFISEENGETSEKQLRFRIITPEHGASGKVEDYKRAVGSHEGEMRIVHTPQPEQEKLKLGTGEPDTGCIACNNKIALMDGDETKHASGAKCTAKPKTKRAGGGE